MTSNHNGEWTEWIDNTAYFVCGCKCWCSGTMFPHCCSVSFEFAPFLFRSTHEFENRKKNFSFCHRLFDSHRPVSVCELRLCIFLYLSCCNRWSRNIVFFNDEKKTEHLKCKMKTVKKNTIKKIPVCSSVCMMYSWLYVVCFFSLLIHQYIGIGFMYARHTTLFMYASIARVPRHARPYVCTHAHNDAVAATVKPVCYVCYVQFQ